MPVSDVPTPARWIFSRLVDFVVAARRRPWISIGVPALAAAIGVAIALLLEPRFPAHAAFLPQSESGSATLSGGLAGLASQFGVISPKSDNPLFYAELLENPAILQAVLKREHPAGVLGEERSMTLAEALDIENFDDPAGREAATRLLTRRVSPAVNRRTGLVTFTVEAKTPQLAVAIARDLLAALDSFNIHLRNVRATEQQRFIEQRVVDAANALRAAEDSLRRFLVANRNYAGSPTLQFEHGRLERSVQLRQSLYTALRQQLDQATVDAARNTSSLLVIREPLPVTRKVWPKRRFIVIVAGLIGVLVAMVLLWFAEPKVFSHGDNGAWREEVERLRTAVSRKAGDGRALPVG